MDGSVGAAQVVTFAKMIIGNYIDESLIFGALIFAVLFVVKYFGIINPGNLVRLFKKDKHPTGSLKGKKIIFLGSSVTQGWESLNKTFVEMLADRTGAAVVREAVPSTFLVDEKAILGESYVTRLKKLNVDKADLFVCQLSTNDATKHKPMGAISESMDIDSFDVHTICGAIEYIIAYAKQTWNCPVVFYTSPQFGSVEYKRMVEVLYEIAKKWDIQIIDLWTSAAANQKKYKKWRAMNDEIHPTRKSYEAWTPLFESAILDVLAGRKIQMEVCDVPADEKLKRMHTTRKVKSWVLRIYEIFNKEYPHLPGFAKVIDNKINYAQSLIDDFSDPKKLPQIAISVDMLDTGIDVPECLNLVFFKKVMSKAKFWQMIGRGTRLCPGLKDGADKDKFYIFDFCGNFEFFRMSNGKPTAIQMALQGAIFNLKAQIIFKLQDLAYQTPELIEFRKVLVEDMVRKVQELNKENFAVRQHLKFVELYSNPDHYATLTYENTLQMREELAPLITPDEDDAKAVRFDALLYGIELAYLMGKKYAKARTDLIKKVSGIASVANIPEIMVQKPLLEKILNTDYLETAGINEFEHIRESLRDLIKYIPAHKVTYTTNFSDEILTIPRRDCL